MSIDQYLQNAKRIADSLAAINSPLPSQDFIDSCFTRFWKRVLTPWLSSVHTFLSIIAWRASHQTFTSWAKVAALQGTHQLHTNFCCTFCFYNYSTKILVLSSVIIVAVVDLLHQEVVAMVAKVMAAVVVGRISSSRKRWITAPDMLEN